MERKETWLIDDILAKFILEKKDDKGTEFDVLMDKGNVLEFGWFKEPEEGSTMFIRYTDHNTHCANTPLKEPTLGEIRGILQKYLK